MSATDLWAVGSSQTSGTTGSTLIEHSGGHKWKQVASPDPAGAAAAYLDGVDAVSSGDVWAVGYTGSEANGTPLIEHSGGHVWKIVSSPAPANGGALFAVDGVSADDVWAVGLGAGGSATLAEQWNGHAWAIVPGPAPWPAGSGATLFAVDAVSADDVWAVGYAENQTLAEQWNGTSWTIVPTPDPSTGAAYLYGVDAVSADDVWAVGYGNNQALAEHWDGASWTIVPIPDPAGAIGTHLYGVAAASSDDAWAVGASYNGSAWSPLIEHWNGKKWKIVSAAEPAGAAAGYLQGVAAVSSGDLWAAGYSETGSAWSTLAEHSDGHAWRIVTSANP